MNIFHRKFYLSPEEKVKRKKERLLLLLSGTLLGLSFPPFPFPFQLLMFFALIPFLYVVEQRKGLAEINKASYLTFFIFNLITIYWVGSWQTGTDLFLMIAGGVLLFFSPLLFLIPTTLYYFAKKNLNEKSALLLFPFFWLTYEYFYTLTDISFPWLTLGSGLSKFNVFIQASDIIGAFGLSVIVIYINVFIFLAIKYYKRKPRISAVYMLVTILIFSFSLTYGVYKKSTFKMSSHKIKVGLIQPNINPWEKWKSNKLKDLKKEYLILSQEAVDKGAKILIWPETALPVYLNTSVYSKTKNDITKFLEKTKTFLLTGMPDIKYFNKNDRIPIDAKVTVGGNLKYAIYNSVLGFSYNNKIVQHYGKIKLVPFGERVPFVNTFKFLGDIFSWGVGLGGWNVGQDTTLFVFNYDIKSDSTSKTDKQETVKISSLVCYESVYPIFVAAFVKKGAQLITIVTNDSWYGKSSGPYQHKEISVLRAVENRRYVVRAANGGISCIIDPVGRTIKETKLFTKDVLVGNVSLESDLTFYSKHPMIIPLLAVLISLTILFFALFKKVFGDKSK
ncbi:MAG: apolipoprotein N-acyltransferase [Bacteroidetes bacterium]|nr:apolipoprotein N-acyltransferase [Bacteroidota bacterium]